MIVDFHTHAFPDELAYKAVSGLSQRASIPYMRDGTVQSLKECMRRSGVTHAVLCTIAVKPGQSEKANAFAGTFLQEKDSALPQKIIPFAGVHPDDGDWREMLRRIKEDGFPGVKLHPDYQQFFIDDPKMEPVYREIARLGLVVVFHAGLDVGLPEPMHCTPERVMNVLPLLEGCTTVLAHMGGFNTYEETLKYLCGRNLYFDTSYCLHRMERDTAKRIFQKHGADRFLFGSDSPWSSQQESLAYFEHTFCTGYFSREDREKILWKNGAKLLRLS